MRCLTTGLVIIASLSLVSCDRGEIANPPSTTGLLNLTLAPATITKCQSVVLDDPYVKNTTLKGRSSIEVRERGKVEPIGRYPNATSTAVVLDSAGDYVFTYII